MSMNTSIVIAGAIAVLSSATGCRWFDKAVSEHHEKNAEAAAKEGNFGQMMDEGKKAHEADKRAKSDPLP